MPKFPRQFLLPRAANRCEYCHLPEEYASLGLQVDHVIAQQHKGRHDIGNLAMACLHCNKYKGPNLASIDPTDFKMARLFNPRTQRWSAHFAVVGDKIVGLTPIGRATVNLLGFNTQLVLTRRRELQRLGVEFD